MPGLDDLVIVITFPTPTILCEWLWSHRCTDQFINSFVADVRASGDRGHPLIAGGFHYLVGLA